MKRPGILRRRSARTAAALLAAALMLALTAGCGAGGGGGSSTAQAAVAAGRGQPVQVTAGTLGKPIPSGFVGLSIEEKALEQFAGTNPGALDPVFLHLVEDIAPEQSPSLRIGGDSTDWSWWPVPHVAKPPGVKYTLTPTWMSVARGLATALNAKLILGVDLEADSSSLASTEAVAMIHHVGRSSIQALELGNEPELYGSFGWYRSAVTDRLVPGRPHSYDMPTFIGDFGRIARALPSVPVAGPSMGGPHWLEQLGSFVGAEPRLKLVTVHAYPLKHCTKSTVITAAQLLSQDSSLGLAQRVAPFVAEASHRHLPLRIDEMNGISCGGTRGVSDTFASSLWVLDTLFEMARAGVNGVNIHGVPDTINELLGPEFAGGHWSVRVHPEYYGMIMFAQAAPPGSRLLRVTSKLPTGVKVWATRSSDGSRRVVVINKQLAGGATVALHLGSSSVATVEQLRAPSIHATTGVTLGGETFGAATTTGVLNGPATNLTVTPRAGVYSVSVPAASATMLILPKP